MKRIKNFFTNLASNLKTTVIRFPVVLLALAFICIINFILIENTYYEEDFLIRLMFTGIFAAFLTLSIQFACERFERLCRIKWVLRSAALPAAILYFFFMTSSDTAGAAMFIRLFVCCFALIAIALYLPSIKDSADFNKISLVHFKSVFIALLYGLILFLGLNAIYYAIDLLLIKLDDNIPAHIANIVFIFFTPVYYLSLLPYFNTEEEEQIKKREESSVYPRFLAILISYIAIPLITAYTAVLVLYFIKILITLKWPVGQIGPMVLIYSAAGLFIYILCGQLMNRFAVLFRKYFPFAEIVLVCLQLISVFIRLKAYGVTESRYYVTIFGIFSIICALYLIISKLKKPGMIALLAACFAVFSIIPPVDAFSVSRISQTNRVEEILIRNGMLTGNTLTPKSSISPDDKREITSIIFYMANMGHLSNIQWLPEKDRDNDMYTNFDQLFGFSPYYGGGDISEKPPFINVFLDLKSPLDITGFETLMRVEFNSNTSVDMQSTSFTFGDKKYTVKEKILQNGEIVLSISDEASGGTVIDIPLKDLFDKIALTNAEKTGLPASQMMIEMKNDALRVRVVIENISMEISSSGDYSNIGGSAFVLVSRP